VHARGVPAHAEVRGSWHGDEQDDAVFFVEGDADAGSCGPLAGELMGTRHLRARGCVEDSFHRHASVGLLAHLGTRRHVLTDLRQDRAHGIAAPYNLWGRDAKFVTG
jgi:hypothetical protein